MVHGLHWIAWVHLFSPKEMGGRVLLKTKWTKNLWQLGSKEQSLRKMVNHKWTKIIPPEFTTGGPEIDRYGWWSKMLIAGIEIVDWWLKMSIAIVEAIDCWLRIIVAMVQKPIEYQDWRLLWLEKRLVSEDDRQRNTSHVIMRGKRHKDTNCLTNYVDSDNESEQNSTSDCVFSGDTLSQRGGTFDKCSHQLRSDMQPFGPGNVGVAQITEHSAPDPISLWAPIETPNHFQHSWHYVHGHWYYMWNCFCTSNCRRRPQKSTL